MVNSDQRVREDVSQALEGVPGVDVGNIELSVAEGVVTLSGTVPDAETWHRAQSAVAAVEGVRRVDNTLRLSEGRLNEALNDLSAAGAPGTRRTEG
jgi:osmotically-inducible protein OsmY